MSKRFLILFILLTAPLSVFCTTTGTENLTQNTDTTGGSGGTIVYPDWIDTTTPCADRSCTVEGTETTAPDKMICKWENATLHSSILGEQLSADKQCYKKWFCTTAGWYPKKEFKLTPECNNGICGIKKEFVSVSCVQCPQPCINAKEPANDCKKNATTDGTITYSTAQSINDCFLRTYEADSDGKTNVGTDEIGTFYIKPDDDAKCNY